MPKGPKGQQRPVARFVRGRTSHADAVRLVFPRSQISCDFAAAQDDFVRDLCREKVESIY
jgi:hypothetical protein